MSLPSVIIAVSSRAELRKAICAAFLPRRVAKRSVTCGTYIEFFRVLTGAQIEAIIIDNPAPFPAMKVLQGIKRAELAAVPVFALNPAKSRNARIKLPTGITPLRSIDALPQLLECESTRRALESRLRRTEALLEGQTHDLRERIKELNCLYNISRLANRCILPGSAFFSRLLRLIQKSWQYPALARARIRVCGKEYAAPGFKQTPWVQSADVLTQRKVIGRLEICYLKECPPADVGPFLHEEQALIQTIGKHIGDLVARKEAEAAILRHQKMLEESQTAVRAFSARVLSAREEERKRIANTLHDELGSVAVLLGSRLKITKTLAISGKSPEVIRSLEEIHGAFLESIEGLKHLAKDLRPPNFEMMGLSGALAEMVAQFSDKSGMRIRLDSAALALHSLPEELAISLYRIVQEAINNAIEHSGGRNINIRFSRRSGSGILTIKDDGKGFNPAAGHIMHKTGIQGIRERSVHHGGTLRIDSAPNKGTILTISFPLPKDAGSVLHEHKRRTR